MPPWTTPDKARNKLYEMIIFVNYDFRLLLNITTIIEYIYILGRYIVITKIIIYY